MTRPLTEPSPRCRYCGKLMQFCPDPTGHEIMHAQNEDTWRRNAARRMAGAILTPDAIEADREAQP